MGSEAPALNQQPRPGTRPRNPQPAVWFEFSGFRFAHRVAQGLACEPRCGQLRCYKGLIGLQVICLLNAGPF